nr:cytochrome P450 [uncultured Chryseobacterium sp.]
MKDKFMGKPSCPGEIKKCPYSESSYLPIDFHDPIFIANPALAFQELRNVEPIQKIILEDGFPVWIISKYKDVIDVLRDPRFIKSPNSLRESNNGQPRGKTIRDSASYILRRNHLLANDPPVHARLRGAAQKIFNKKMIISMRSRIQQITDELIDQILEGNQEFDFINDFAFQLPIIVIAELLGLPVEDREKIKEWSYILPEVQITEKNKQLIEDNSKAFMDYLKNIFSLRREKPEDDLISQFVKLQETDDHISENELYSMVFLLIVAGHETTVHLISNGIYALLSHPEQLNLLKNNPELIDSAIEEMLRFNGPILTSTMRLASEDINLKGSLIKKGEGVMVLVSSANHDEAEFYDSLRFDITRKDNKHIAFGYGIHFCIGAPLARLECEIAISSILKRLPNLRLTSEAQSPEWRASNLIRGLKNFPVSI